MSTFRQQQLQRQGLLKEKELDLQRLLALQENSRITVHMGTTPGVWPIDRVEWDLIEPEARAARKRWDDKIAPLLKEIRELKEELGEDADG